MAIVTAQMSVSVDGYYAGPKHTDMQTWLEGPEAAGFFRVTRWVIDAEAWRERLGFDGGEQNTNSEIIAETFGSAGAYVMGRRMADGGEIPWGEEPRSAPRCSWSPTAQAGTRLTGPGGGATRPCQCRAGRSAGPTSRGSPCATAWAAASTPTSRTLPTPPSSR